MTRRATRADAFAATRLLLAGVPRAPEHRAEDLQELTDNERNILMEHESGEAAVFLHKPRDRDECQIAWLLRPQGRGKAAMLQVFAAALAEWRRQYPDCDDWPIFGRMTGRGETDTSRIADARAQAREDFDDWLGPLGYVVTELANGWIELRGRFAVVESRLQRAVERL